MILLALYILFQHFLSENTICSTILQCRPLFYELTFGHISLKLPAKGAFCSSCLGWVQLYSFEEVKLLLICKIRLHFVLVQCITDRINFRSSWDMLLKADQIVLQCHKGFVQPRDNVSLSRGIQWQHNIHSKNGMLNLPDILTWPWVRFRAPAKMAYQSFFLFGEECTL